MATEQGYEQQGQHGQQQMHPDAVAMLKADHDLVESLFTQCEQTDGTGSANRAQLTQRLFQALQLHTAIEEELVYPLAASQLYEQGEPLLQDFHAAHTTVAQMIDRLRQMDPHDSAFLPAFQELMENVRAHVEEEETTLFPDLEGLSTEQQAQLGIRMQQRHQEQLKRMQTSH